MILTITTSNDQFKELVKVTLEEKQTLTDNNNYIQLKVMDKSAKNLNFVVVSLTNQRKSILQLEKKSRNVSSNISYAGINKEDFYNENFIFDVYLLVIKNLNPFLLNRKLNDQNKH